jgi:outer membrane lipoprotein-sorting protein
MRDYRIDLKYPCSLFIILVALTSIARADAKLDTIIQKSIEAAGGKTKLASIKTVSMRGTVNVAAQGVSGTFSIDKKTDRAVMRIHLKDIGEINYGWVNNVVYETSDLTGTRLVNGAEREQLLRDLDMSQAFTRLSTLKNCQIDGEETLGEQKTWRIVGTTAAGTTETNWIDQTTYLPVRTKMIVNTQMGELEAVVDFKDYKTIDGVPIPLLTEQAAGPMVMVLKIDDIKINPDIADDLFGLPDEVNDLLNQSADHIKAESTTRPLDTPSAQPQK